MKSEEVWRCGLRPRAESLPAAEAEASRACAELRKEEWLLAAPGEELVLPREVASARVRVVSAPAGWLVSEVFVEQAAAWE